LRTVEFEVKEQWQLTANTCQPMSTDTLGQWGSNNAVYTTVNGAVTAPGGDLLRQGYPQFLVKFPHLGRYRAIINAANGSFTVEEAAATKLLANGDFERGAEGEAEGWTLTSRATGISGGWEPNCGRNGNGCLHIRVDSPYRADVGFKQTVTGLQPFHSYILRGYAKALNARRVENSNEDGTVVNLSFADHSEFPKNPGGMETQGTFDWKIFQYDTVPRVDQRLEPMARLGFYWNESAGEAWFDDLELVENPDVRVQLGQHVAFTVWKSDSSAMSDANLERWVSHLDASYEAMQELTGRVPADGEKIGYYWPKWNYPAGACWASIPVACGGGDTAETQEFMTQLAQTDDWGFGQVHELGHLFQFGPFAFEAEFFANWHLYYALTTRGGKAGDGATTEFWQKKYQETWVANHNPYHDGLQYKWILIQKQIGWEPFKATYRWIAEHEGELPTGSWDLLKLWHDKLTEYSGVNVWDFFSADEIAMMQARGIT
jgi:hypothetical protein